jgi:predicted DNA-binding protein
MAGNDCRRSTVTFRCSDLDRARLHELARRLRRTPSDALRILIEDGLNNATRNSSIAFTALTNSAERAGAGDAR